VRNRHEPIAVAFIYIPVSDNTFRLPFGAVAKMRMRGVPQKMDAIDATNIEGSRDRFPGFTIVAPRTGQKIIDIPPPNRAAMLTGGCLDVIFGLLSLFPFPLIVQCEGKRFDAFVVKHPAMPILDVLRR